MQAPGLICASSARPSRSRVDGKRRQLRHDPVAFGQQRRQRHVAGLQFALLGFRRPRALMVKHMHVEGPGADGNLVPDLAQANDADGRTVERAGAAEAGVVAARRVLAVERPDRRRAAALMRSTVTRPSSSSSLRASISISPKACSAQEMLARRRSVSSFDALFGAGGGVDVAQPGAEFLHDLELGAAAARSSRVDAERLDHQRDAIRADCARISASDVTIRTSAG